MTNSSETIQVEPESKSHIIHLIHPDTKCKRAGKLASISIKAKSRRDALNQVKLKNVVCSCGAFYELSESD